MPSVLTDDDFAEMAAALPNLVETRLGKVCSADSCRTMVAWRPPGSGNTQNGSRVILDQDYIASLLILPTHCKDLRCLEIHFSTGNILHDLESVQRNPRLRDLYALPKCRVGILAAYDAPL